MNFASLPRLSPRKTKLQFAGSAVAVRFSKVCSDDLNSEALSAAIELVARHMAASAKTADRFTLPLKLANGLGIPTANNLS